MGDKANLQSELEALRRELRHAPPVQEEPGASGSSAPADDKGIAGKAASVFEELQARISDGAEEAEDANAAHPFAAVAAAFLAGVLVAKLMSPGR